MATYDVNTESAGDPMMPRIFSELPEVISALLITKKCVNCDEPLYGFKPIIYLYDKEKNSVQWWHFRRCDGTPHESVGLGDSKARCVDKVSDNQGKI